jgi:hypothetical protein
MTTKLPTEDQMAEAINRLESGDAWAGDALKIGLALLRRIQALESEIIPALQPEP